MDFFALFFFLKSFVGSLVSISSNCLINLSKSSSNFFVSSSLFEISFEALVLRLLLAFLALKLPLGLISFIWFFKTNFFICAQSYHSCNLTEYYFRSDISLRLFFLWLSASDNISWFSVIIATTIPNTIFAIVLILLSVCNLTEYRTFSFSSNSSVLIG